MYELKKNGKVFTSKSVGTGPSSCEKRIYRAAVSQSLRDTGLHCGRGGDYYIPHSAQTGLGYPTSYALDTWVPNVLCIGYWVFCHRETRPGHEPDCSI